MSVPSEATAPTPVALAEPVVRVRAPFLAGLALANLGIMMAFFTPIQNLLPRLSEQIAGAGGKETALAWVTGVGAFVAIVANPLAGALHEVHPRLVVAEHTGDARPQG